MDGRKQLDLRNWLHQAEATDQLQVVEGADWNQEICALSHHNVRQPNHKALLFDRIPGYPQGVRILTNAMTSAPRLGQTLRLGERLNHEQILAAVDGKPKLWEETAAQYPLQYVSDGPVCENVLGPEEYNLLKFPVPLWHQHDGGRYIGTGCAVITQHPETGVTNAGSYRMMVAPDGKTVFMHIVGARHAQMHVDAWVAKEGRAPIVASVGHDPLLFALAGNEVPFGISELEYAGAIAGESMQVVRGVTGLPIPARSEVVIEGWLYPDRVQSEGPFGEWHGHYSGLRRNGEKAERLDPVIEVERVYHRNDPILLGAPPGQPPHDFTYFRSVLKSAMIKDTLVRAGVPGVKNVWVYESGGARVFMAISIKQSYLGHARQAGLMALECPAGYYAGKWAVVVDEDVDPSDLNQVIWAMCFRCQPSEDIDFVRKTLGDKGDATVEPGRPYSSRAVIDACIPLERQNTSWMRCDVRPDVLENVRQRYAKIWA